MKKSTILLKIDVCRMIVSLENAKYRSIYLYNFFLWCFDFWVNNNQADVLWELPVEYDWKRFSVIGILYGMLWIHIRQFFSSQEVKIGPHWKTYLLEKVWVISTHFESIYPKRIPFKLSESVRWWCIYSLMWKASIFVAKSTILSYNGPCLRNCIWQNWQKLIYSTSL